MRVGPQKLFSSHFEWQIGAILFRSILSAIVVLLLIQAVVFKEAERIFWTVFAAVAAAGAAFALFSWRTPYLGLARKFRTALVPLSSRLGAAMLMYRANQIRAKQLRRLLVDLEQRRQYLRPFLEASAAFREFANDMIILVLRGGETPLATLVFSEALDAVGLQVKLYEDFREIISERSVDELRKMYKFKRLAIVFDEGVPDQAARLLQGFLLDRPAAVFAIPLFLLSQSGEGLFPDELLYELAVESHVGLKAYLRQAASLAKRPEDMQFEAQGRNIPPVYR